MKTEKKPLLRIKEIMTQKEISREDLAVEVGVSNTTISNICSHTNYPALDLLPRLAKALKVDIRELFIPTKTSPITDIEVFEARELIEKGLKILSGKR
jgi:transcriptional regulator with XRE-family HTH domain